ncbi:hypothetical protein PILCRDRAFT_3077 [Piloderma croceum F 1598]|uniref:Exocyst complex component EXO84 n=1 Tax=Piloderma croceum (strain F 1598) TaxID=765440 RepID=A0A0C3GB10_PILCF|nr:hypothetical protein PILCRDRAFT_3077 [Piloderma croceum F 1598]
MQSLRTRKPSEPQKPLRSPSKLSKQSSSASAKDARKSRVDDRIKKRMSMRYADISGPTNASVPPMPTMPMSLRPGVIDVVKEEVQSDDGASKKEKEKEKYEDPRIADRKMLDKEDFDPDAYLKLKLANSTESELRSLQSSLRSSKDDVASDLQRNVFKNYAEFVLISKEISVLENEMLELKESLAEWRSMPSLLHIDESASAAERRRNARSSIADLRVLYANQMQTLHSQIEGSAKFAPTTAGRHVVTEMDGILSLNAATYKVDHGVKFVVLDDAVLVAKRRRNRNASGKSTSGRLVAERCWPLSEMLVLDTKDSANMTNVFKIRHGKETHVYRTENPSDKKSLLGQFRQVAEELAAKKRKEREGEHERRKSLWAGGDRASVAWNADALVSPVPDWMADLAHRAGGDGSSAKEKAERDARWVGEFADELTVAIALREWNQAVSLVEQGKTKLSTTPPLAAKLTPLTVSLTNALLGSLALPTNRKSTVVNLIALLLRLNAGPPARSMFLAARTEVMRKHIRAIRFEGHIGMYINDLAVVVFTGIKHTADWFLASFKENEVASCFIDWAKQQIENYAEMFRKQVYSSDVESKTVEEALQITYNQSKKLLQEYGLDFRFLLDELLVENPKDSTPQPFTFNAEPIARRQDVMPTPRLLTPTPATRPPAPAMRSTPPTPTSSSMRSRTPQPSLAAAPSPPPLVSPQPRRVRSPPPESPKPSRATAQTPTNDLVRSPKSRISSPAPPPRSSNRPGSSPAQRPPPVAIPRREGMI